MCCEGSGGWSAKHGRWVVNVFRIVAFALGLTLFVITLCLNIYALYIVRKYREQYE